MQVEGLVLQVLQLKSHVLQILLSDSSPNSLVFVQELSQVLVLLLPHLGKRQPVAQVEILR